MEADLLAICKDKGRIIKIQHRTFINYPNISMLLKDMPTDEDAYGQLLDHLTVLAEGANEKTEVLIKDSDARNQQQKEALETARETGQEINDEFKEYCEKTSKILNNLVDEIEKGMFYLALTDEQEKYFTNLTSASQNELTALFENSLKIDEKITKLVKHL